MVKTHASAKERVIAVEIDLSLLQRSEGGMLADVVAAALNGARAKADPVSSAEMSKMIAGTTRPPSSTLLF